MMPYILWDRDKRAEFHSLRELEYLVDQLTIQAEQDQMPIGIQIQLNSDTSLLITVGCAESHVGFYSTTARPLAVVCRGPWDSDELIEVNFMGEPSTVEKRYCVPIGDAREAIRRYILTGMRPDNIRWKI